MSVLCLFSRRESYSAHELAAATADPLSLLSADVAFRNSSFVFTTASHSFVRSLQIPVDP